MRLSKGNNELMNVINVSIPHISQLLLCTTQQFVYSTGNSFKQAEIVVIFKIENLPNTCFPFLWNTKMCLQLAKQKWFRPSVNILGLKASLNWILNLSCAGEDLSFSEMEIHWICYPFWGSWGWTLGLWHNYEQKIHFSLSEFCAGVSR